MQVAQSLYENGHITYMRTDSTNLAKVAIEAARELVATQYGREYLPAEPRVYQTKVKNAQEAHEAIRPAGHPFEFPESLRGELNPDEFKLYDLIWKRTIASQMADARGRRITITIEGDGARVPGQRQDDRLPRLSAGLRRRQRRSGGRTGRPRDGAAAASRSAKRSTAASWTPRATPRSRPAGYSEAALTAALEEMGIGRPSTYASIIDTILAREYVFKKGNALVPTWVAFAVAQLLEEHLPNLVDYQFTAQMEDDLDAISRGETESRRLSAGVLFRQRHAGPEAAAGQQGRRDRRPRHQPHLDRQAAKGGEAEIFVRVGRYGPFLEQGERRREPARRHRRRTN